MVPTVGDPGGRRRLNAIGRHRTTVGRDDTGVKANLAVRVVIDGDVGAPLAELNLVRAHIGVEQILSGRAGIERNWRAKPQGITMPSRNHRHIRMRIKSLPSNSKAEPGSRHTPRIANPLAAIKPIATIVSNITGVKAPISHEAVVDTGLRQEHPKCQGDTRHENLSQRSHTCPSLV